MNFRTIYRSAKAMLKKLILPLVVLFSTVLWAQDIPEPMSPPRLVNDFVGALNSTENNTLEQKLRAYNDSTSTHITVVVVKTTQPYPVSDYAFELGRRWGVGQKDKDNGLVLLWATDDRKIYIATGYGLEGAIPDVIAKRIIREVIAPHFKNKMYYQGLNEGTSEIIKYASGEYKADPTATSSDGSEIYGIIFLFILFIILYAIFSRRNGGNGGGGRRNYGGGGMWFPYMTHSGWGSSSGSWGGNDSSSGGGFDFGGFGGGDFGGGGAGGDY
jgi:uncharacterized protein